MRMSKGPQTRIFLTGGLGNQLFQLAAAFYFSEVSQISINTRVGKPRLNKATRPELLTLKLQSNIAIEDKNYGFIFGKILGYNLRTGYDPKNFESSSLARKLRIAISNVLISIFLLRKTRVHVARNLGYDALMLPSGKNQVLVGYFQSYLYAGRIKEIAPKLFDGQLNNYEEEFRQLSQDENPLIVHVRLGDYKSEDRLGVLSLNYYENAIEAMMSTQMFQKIWLFSDEPKDAILRVPAGWRNHVRVIDSNNLESAETLKLMTLGHGYVIANSTFGWWGAFLSENPNSRVIAPVPWFKSHPEPRELVPPNWERLNGF